MEEDGQGRHGGGAAVRVLTFNVHGWRDLMRRSNTRRVADLVRRLRPHVMCLQEVQDRSRWLADDFGAAGTEDPKSTNLSLFRSLVEAPLPGEEDEGGAWAWEWEWMIVAEWGGSLIASRLPVVSRYRHELTSDGSKRPLVGMRVKLPGELGEVDVLCVHLDHLKETSRKAQLEEIFSYMKASGCLPVHLMLGDFNAISREDYTDEEWQRLGTTRAAARWEAPLSEVTDLLVQRGYYNVPLDNLFALNEEGKEEDEEDEPEAFTERWTCWAGTRIDYAWSTDALRQKVSDDGLQLAAVSPSFQHSDHRALLLTLRDANLSSSSMP